MISFRLTECAEVASTNDVVKRAIEAGEPGGFAVRADAQTAGYGRQGRTWASPAGGLYLSVLLRPNVEARLLPTLSLATAVAVRRALVGFVAPDVAANIQIKWPNDIVVPAPPDELEERSAATCHERIDHNPALSDEPVRRGAYRKLAGISHELHAGAMCVGIGVNVAEQSISSIVVGGELAKAACGQCGSDDANGSANPSASPSSEPAAAKLHTGGKGAPISMCELAGATVAVRDVADAVLAQLGKAYRTWVDEGPAPALAEFARHSFLTGRSVRVATVDGAVVCEGAVRGIDEDARLIVADASGELHRVSSGEAHLV